MRRVCQPAGHGDARKCHSPSCHAWLQNDIHYYAALGALRLMLTFLRSRAFMPRPLDDTHDCCSHDSYAMQLDAIISLAYAGQLAGRHTYFRRQRAHYQGCACQQSRAAALGAAITPQGYRLPRRTPSRRRAAGRYQPC